MNSNRRGVTIIHVVLITAAILAIAGGAFVLGRRGINDSPKDLRTSQQGSDDQRFTNPAPSMSSDANQSSSSNTNTEMYWQQRENGWVAVGTPPACPNPMNLPVPADIAKATGILYPGQTRGGNYKPHGGFRFDNSKNEEITVKAPMNAVIVNGARYIAEGEIQYTFDFIAPCGIMYRLGHLRVLSPKYQAIAEKFPEAKEGDSRTEFVNPPVAVTAGETIATAVGIIKDSNTFFDWGVYDLRSKNEASKNASWASQHPTQLEQNAVCWFDLLSEKDEATVRSLPPGDPTSGKTSDYCK